MDQKKKYKNRISRIVYVHPSLGELYYLSMLLTIVKRPRNYDEIRSTDGIMHPIFQSACNVLGLLGDANNRTKY